MAIPTKQRTCKNRECNKIFWPKIGQWYCCVECRPKITKTCELCEKQFKVFKTYKNAKFCSDICKSTSFFMGKKQKTWKGENASKLAKWGWFHAHFGGAFECHNVNCTGKSKNFCYVEIEHDVEKDRVMNFSQVCYSCKGFRTFGREPSWDWARINLWHAKLDKFIKEKFAKNEIMEDIEC